MSPSSRRWVPVPLETVEKETEESWIDSPMSCNSVHISSAGQSERGAPILRAELELEWDRKRSTIPGKLKYVSLSLLVEEREIPLPAKFTGRDILLSHMVTKRDLERNLLESTLTALKEELRILQEKNDYLNNSLHEVMKGSREGNW